MSSTGLRRVLPNVEQPSPRPKPGFLSSSGAPSSEESGLPLGPRSTSEEASRQPSNQSSAKPDSDTDNAPAHRSASTHHRVSPRLSEDRSLHRSRVVCRNSGRPAASDRSSRLPSEEDDATAWNHLTGRSLPAPDCTPVRRSVRAACRDPVLPPKRPTVVLPSKPPILPPDRSRAACIRRPKSPSANRPTAFRSGRSSR